MRCSAAGRRGPGELLSNHQRSSSSAPEPPTQLLSIRRSVLRLQSSIFESLAFSGFTKHHITISRWFTPSFRPRCGFFVGSAPRVAWCGANEPLSKKRGFLAGASRLDGFPMNVSEKKKKREREREARALRVGGRTDDQKLHDTAGSPQKKFLAVLWLQGQKKFQAAGSHTSIWHVLYTLCCGLVKRQCAPGTKLFGTRQVANNPRY